MTTFWERQELTHNNAELLVKVTRKKWVKTTFSNVNPLDILFVLYMTHSQKYMYDWEDQCGVVLSLNRNEYGDIYSITLLLVSNYQQVEIPYEREEEEQESMGGYTNDHITELQKLV